MRGSGLITTVATLALLALVSTATAAPSFFDVGSVTRYRLLLQKQPGTIGDSVRVVVQLPAGAELLTTTPAASRSGDELLFELTLVADQEILLEWSN